MLKTIFEIKTPTQTINIPADDGKGAAIQSCTLTECVNSGEDLTLGSTCANSLEATLMLLDGDLNIQAGDTVTVRKQLDNNTPTPVGVFVLEKPTRATANTMKIVGYDNVSKLDKDLTLWLSKLEGWPYKLTEFAKLVCEDGCKITFNVSDVPNGDFEIYQFSRSAVTGRQIMQWLGEICCRFCHANAQGNIEFAWYTDSGKTFSSSGEQYYFQNGLTYENFETAAINAVQIRLSDSENGALWPSDTAENANSYIISGNPILSGRLTEDLSPVLENIKEELASVRYTPCKVSVPACLDIHAGNTVKITDKNGKTITTYIMTKTQQGQQDTLECTGNHRRDSSSTVNNQSASSTAAAAAQNAVANMTQEQVFNKLTNDGTIQGLFMKDGQMYINAEYLAAGIIASADGTVKIDLANNFVTIDGERNGYKTQIKLSSSGLQGFGENTEGEMEHVLDFGLGVGGRPTELWNMAHYENVGLSIGTTLGEVNIGTTEASTSIYGGTIELVSAILGAVISVGLDSLQILGKTVSWEDNSDGTYTLIGQ